jgi:hypothetical protein
MNCELLSKWDVYKIQGKYVGLYIVLHVRVICFK